MLARFAYGVLDLIFPGLGKAWSGRRAGYLWMLVWIVTVVGVPWSVASGHFPLRGGILFLAGLYLAYQGLVQTMRVGPEPLSLLAGVGTSLGSALLLFVCLFVVLGPRYAVVRVTDLCEFPLLVPGDVLLVEKSPRVRISTGDLVVFGSGGHNIVARLVAGPGQDVRVSGASLSLDGAVVKLSQIGDALVPKGLAPPEELRQLKVFSESLGDRTHYVFHRPDVVMAPLHSKVPEDHVFLLCDNRGTSRKYDSTNAGVVPVRDVVGRVTMVLWSTAARRWSDLWSRLGSDPDPIPPSPHDHAKDTYG